MTIVTPKAGRAKLSYVATENYSYETSEAWNDEALPLLTSLIFRETNETLRKIRRNEFRESIQSFSPESLYSI